MSEVINALLREAESGDREAWSKLVELVYPELKRLARGSLSGRGPHTLDTTALVHECYLRLSQAAGAPRDSGHLMALAVRIMRQVLIDHARERLAEKRGAGVAAVTLNEAHPDEEREFHTLLEIDAALRCLAAELPRQAQVFECRYFGGLNDEETATTLGISARTAHRDWDAGRAWLADFLNREGAPPR